VSVGLRGWLMLNSVEKKSSCIAGLIFILLLVPAMAVSAAESKAETVRLAVIPFQSLLPESSEGNSVRSPISGAAYFNGKIAKGAESIVEEIFINKLKDISHYEIIDLARVEGVYHRISAESLKAPLSEILKKTGAELGADIVAAGYVFRFVERIGYHYSAEKPASVAFEISFIQVRDGRMVWRGVFDKTQKSLMEDLFQIASFYRGGGKWLNAYELTQQGMDQTFKTFTGFER